MKSLFVSAALFFAAALPVAAGGPAFDGPVFDTHMHYSRSAWAVYSPGDVLQKMDKANVAAALVSSTPGEGTARLVAFAPGRITAGYRPYMTPSDRTRWFKSAGLLSLGKTRLMLRRHKAFGEVVLYFPNNLETPQMAQYLKMVAQQNLVLHLHSDAAVVEAVFKQQPEIKILWAHAGFLEPAAVIGRMLGQYPKLWAELSYRADDITGADGVETEWKALFMRFGNRFTIGSDTWNNSRWDMYPYLINRHRNWLGALPRALAQKIAFQNAAALLEKAGPPASRLTPGKQTGILARGYHRKHQKYQSPAG